MATYINYGEDDATVQAAEWLQQVIQQQKGVAAEEAFVQRFQALSKDQENSRQFDFGPLFDLFVDHSEDLFNSIPENRSEERIKEVESFFAVTLSMLQMLEDPEHLERSTSRLCGLFIASEQQSDLRLRLLMMLYNTFNNPTFPVRYKVFKHAIDYAAQCGLFEHVLPYLEYLDSWMVDWEPNINVDDKRRLFCDISRYMRALNKRVEAFNYLKRWSLLFQGAEATELEDKEVQRLTVELMKDALQLPSVIQFDDILQLDTVKAVSKVKQHADLVQLCGIFLTGDVNDLRAFQKKSPKVFEERELNFQDLMSKIRLLTLATLVQGRSEIPLTEVATALEEAEDNVERWVVKALSEGVVDGRIDQLNHKLLVKSSFQRKFEKNEWAFLDDKLSQWVGNLENVIKFIGEQKKLREDATGV